MPKRRTLKQYFPQGAMNVVSGRDLSESLICQNPELASKCEKNFAPASLENVVSIVGRGWFSHCTYRLSYVRSTQTQNLSLLFGVTTIGAHHSVGSSTWDMTQFCSIRCNSC